MFEAKHDAGGAAEITGMPPQMQPKPGMSERTGDRRRTDRAMKMLHELPRPAQEAVVTSLSPEDQRHYGVRAHQVGLAGSPRAFRCCVARRTSTRRRKAAGGSGEPVAPWLAMDSRFWVMECGRCRA